MATRLPGILLAGAGLWLGLLPSANASDTGQPAPKGKVTIAVRDDARPFAWNDETSNKFAGFFWRICTEAVVRANYGFGHFGVTAAQRQEFLQEGAIKGEEPIDLLCDPTTINLERLKRFAEIGKTSDLSFSPIIFVANGSFIKSKIKPLNSLDSKERLECKEIIGEDSSGGSPPDGDGGEVDGPWITLRPYPVTPKISYEVWGYVRGTTIREAVKAEAKKTTGLRECLKEFESHTRTADDLCSGKIHRYFGDADIVTATLRNWKERNAEGKLECAADIDEIVSGGTYEPYAFVVSAAKYQNFPEEYTLALYEMFADRTMERIFVGHFPDAKSPYLETLFLINRVPVGAAPEGEPGAPAPH